MINYDTDFIGWCREQGTLVRARKFDAVDADNVAEEIESWARYFEHMLSRAMELLLATLLACGANRVSQMTLATREVARYDVIRLLDDFPGFKADIHRIIDEAWPGAVSYAASDTDLPPASFPTKCPWDTASILREYWYPESWS
jgi:hypothetical protein